MLKVLAICLCFGAAAPCLAGTSKAQTNFHAAMSEADRASAQGDWAEAARHYKAALRVEPGHAQARFSLAHALRELEHYYEARRHFRLALQARARDRAWVSQCRLQLAACFEATGDYREAGVEYRLALEADAECAEAKAGAERVVAQKPASESK